MDSIDWKFWLGFGAAAIAALYTVLGYYRDKPSGRVVSGRSRGSILVSGALALAAWAAVGLDYYDRHKPIDRQAMLDRWTEMRQHLAVSDGDDLTSQVTRVDGHKYTNCKLGGVGGSVLLYEGDAPVELENCVVNGAITVQSDNPAISNALGLQGGITSAAGGPIVCKPGLPAPIQP